MVSVLQQAFIEFLQSSRIRTQNFVLGVTGNWWIVGAPLSQSALVENKDTIQTKTRKEGGREARKEEREGEKKETDRQKDKVSV